MLADDSEAINAATASQEFVHGVAHGAPGGRADGRTPAAIEVAEAQLYAQLREDEDPAPAQTQTLPPGWSMATHPQYDVPYYYNAALQTSQWHPPQVTPDEHAIETSMPTPPIGTAAAGEAGEEAAGDGLLAYEAVVGTSAGAPVVSGDLDSLSPLETPELRALRLSGAPPPPLPAAAPPSTRLERNDKQRSKAEKRRRREVYAAKQLEKQQAEASSGDGAPGDGALVEALQQERARRRAAEEQLEKQKGLVKKVRQHERREVKRTAEDARQDERRSSKAKARDKKVKAARAVAGAARHETHEVK